MSVDACAIADRRAQRLTALQSNRDRRQHRSTIAGLVKSFGSLRALDGLDLTVRPGEVHGFLGPNGSGKSTTIRVLLGLLRADGGTVRLLGGDPWREAAELHRRLAYVPGDVNLWPNLTGGEAIDLLGRLRGGLDERRRAELVDRFELDPTKKARSYSKGNRQKVALVAALAADVELLLLDEPTSGLDPIMESVFRSCVDDFRDRGHTVLLEQPHPRRGRAALRPGEHHPRGTLRRDRHPRRAPAPDPDVDLGRPGDHAGRPRGAARRARPGGRGRPAPGSRSTPPASTRPSTPSSAPGVLSLTTQPPTLEELFLRHYGDRVGAAEPERMTGTGVLFRTFLRRDRWMLLWWVLGGTVLYWSQAVSVDGLYATQAEFDRAAASMEGNAAFIAMAGPARALNTIGGQVAWQATAFGAVVAGLMSMFIIGRHTRAEEESGRDELVRAAAVDRFAPMTARCWSRWAPTPCSAGPSPSAWPPTRSPSRTRSPSASGSPSAAGSSPAPPWSRRS